MAGQWILLQCRTEIRTDEGVVIFEGSPHKAKVLYGNLLWTGALALSKFFATSSAAPPVKGRSCLELGAGTGVVGLTLGSMGAEPVFITDNEPELLLLMKKNIEANNLSDRVQTFCLDWADGKSFMQQLPDLVVAADVLYEGDGSMFCHALAKHLRIGAEAYVANHHNPDKCEALPDPFGEGSRRQVLFDFSDSLPSQAKKSQCEISDWKKLCSVLETLQKATLGFLRTATRLGLRVERLEELAVVIAPVLKL
ncbi:unnamed protein product [Durusdinium trenchii]|uniref:Calmodulin-lysine N-methyltransferase n=2 Tax=Durusdinium trenchii TaxID=1381693 RepID=A0ABP0L6M2_9DINO